ncbi:MAG: hypothetical protein N2255_02310 [Kiritimatiellae bacterium]|nr:hypothetical protein [Kiritimatiellia bacterium]
MAERSLKVATWFGILGALVFFVIQRILIEFLPSLKDTFVFRTEKVPCDVYFFYGHFRVNLFVVLGFIAGMAFHLFRGGSGGGGKKG